MERIRWATLALVGVALAAFGCGGSSKTGSPGAQRTATTSAPTTTAATVNAPPGKPLTRAELIAGANMICKRINARHASLRLPTQQAIAREIPLFASYQRTALAELGKLIPPASMAHDWKQFVAAARRLARDTTRFGAYAKAHRYPTAGARLLPKITEDERRIGVLAKRYAIGDCEHVY